MPTTGDQKRERRDRRGGMMGEQPRPEAEAEHRSGIGDDQHAERQASGSDGRAERAVPVRRRRARGRSAASGAARLDQTVKASMSTFPSVLATTLPAPQKNEARMTSRNGPKLAPASRSEPITAMPAKATAAPITCARRGRSRQNDPGERDGEEDLHLDDQRGEPDREALVDRDEQEPNCPTPISRP